MSDHPKPEPTVQEIVVALRNATRRSEPEGELAAPPAGASIERLSPSPRRAEPGRAAPALAGPGAPRATEILSFAADEIADSRDAEIRRLLSENSRLNERLFQLLRVIERGQRLPPAGDGAAGLAASITAHEAIRQIGGEPLDARLVPLLSAYLRLAEQAAAPPDSARALIDQSGRLGAASARPAPAPGSRPSTKPAGRPSSSASRRLTMVAFLAFCVMAAVSGTALIPRIAPEEPSRFGDIAARSAVAGQEASAPEAGAGSAGRQAGPSSGDGGVVASRPPFAVSRPPDLPVMPATPAGPPREEPGISPDPAGAPAAGAVEIAAEPPPRLETPQDQPAAATSDPDQELPAAEIALLVRRGEQLLAGGDIISARRFLQRVASFSARAASDLGKTYDPLFLQQLGTRGIAGDAKAAIAAYRNAIRLGDLAAEPRLTALLAKYPE